MADALPIPKCPKHGRVRPKRHENKDHVRWLHDWSCALAGLDCSGPVVAHHLLKPWSGIRGTGRKSGDENGLPLCNGHHLDLHARGDEDAFFEERAGDPDFGRAQARHLWEDSPYRKDAR